jgi:two-component system nitrate/nitrite response regulator NarL
MEPHIPTLMVCTDRELLTLALERIAGDDYRCEIVPSDQAGSHFAQVAPSQFTGIIILDIEAGVVAELIRKIQANMSGVPVIVWQRSGASEPSLNALESGARGVLHDSSCGGDIRACLKSVNEGHVWVSQFVTQAVLNYRRCRLSRREGQLLNLVSQGLRNKEIAYQLGISEGTVKVYFSRLFDKLGVSDRYELALLGLRHYAATPSGAPEATGTASEYPKSVFVNRPVRYSASAIVASSEPLTSYLQ